MKINNKKYIQLFSKILIIVIFALTIIYSLPIKILKKDDITIFGLWNNNVRKIDNNSENNNFIISPKNANIEFKNIKLIDTIEKKQLIREKIAPGTSGKLDIIVENYENNNEMEYNIEFLSQNSKPENLKFNIEGNNEYYSSLDELGRKTKGVIESNTNKTITINWIWEYEVNEESDFQDTKDAIYLKEYTFEIIAKISEKID